jgi:hypothetical protein
MQRRLIPPRFDSGAEKMSRPKPPTMLEQSIVVWDLETVPDLAAARML